MCALRRLEASTTLRICDGVREYIGREGLCDAKSRVLLAVSGGRDSMVMLSLFRHMGHWPLGVAHCNFGLRGEESDGDEGLVRSECVALGVHCHVAHFDTLSHARSAGCSIQVAARALRYAWFDELCAAEGYTCVATAHHAGDLAEGVLLNLARGAGLRGLGGMPARNGRVIRPLLGTSSSDVGLWAEAMGVRYRDDSTNASDKYARNRVRHHVVPALAEVNPRVEMNIGHAARMVSLAHGVLQRMAVERWGGDNAFFPWSAACADGDGALAEWWVGEWLSLRGFSYVQIRSLIEALEGGRVGVRVWADAYVGYVGREGLYLEKAVEEDVATGREYSLGDADGVLSVEAAVGVPSLGWLRGGGEGRGVVYFDTDKLDFPLVLRRWVAGDRIALLGMRGGKKVSDVLTDGRVSPASRRRALVLVSGGEVVWVVGLRQSRRAALDSGTARAVRVMVNERYLPHVEGKAAG